MNLSRIPYVKPSITVAEIELATRAATDGWGSSSNAYIEDFEEQFSLIVGTKYAVATSSCTGALHLGLAALGVTEGDEVILADTNWVATVAPILYLKATPILVDVSLTDWVIDVNQIKKNISSKTKVIIATHLYGNACELNELKELARSLDIFLVEDAAEAIGTFYFGKHVGQFSDFGVFSFHGSKTITTGEGGMLVTNNPEIYERVLVLNSHGRSSQDFKQFSPNALGYKYKMTNMQAAIGLAQISRFGELVNRKREILDFYKSHLSGLKGIQINPVQKNVLSGAWMPNVVFDVGLGISSDDLISAFKVQNIDARPFFYPLSSLKFLAHNETQPNAKSLSDRSINLPSFHDISQLELDRVTQVLFDVYEKAARKS